MPLGLPSLLLLVLGGSSGSANFTAEPERFIGFTSSSSTLQQVETTAVEARDTQQQRQTLKGGLVLRLIRPCSCNMPACKTNSSILKASAILTLVSPLALTCCWLPRWRVLDVCTAALLTPLLCLIN